MKTWGFGLVNRSIGLLQLVITTIALSLFHTICSSLKQAATLRSLLSLCLSSGIDFPRRLFGLLDSRTVPAPQPQQLLIHSALNWNSVMLTSPHTLWRCSRTAFTCHFAFSNNLSPVIEVEVTLQETVSRPVLLGVLPLLEQVTRCYIYLSDNYFLYFSCRVPSLTSGLVCNLQCNDASLISSYIATDGLSASSSWCRASSGAHNQIWISLFDSYFVVSV
jgi:hypothetical protein